MTITQSKNGVIIVKQKEYIKKIVADSGVLKTSTSPNHPNIMKKKTPDVRPLHTQTYYLSLLMSAMFLAKRTRPDILAPVCILATRVQAPDEEDMTSLLRVYEYLKGTGDMGIRYKPESLELVSWILPTTSTKTRADTAVSWPQ
jgi:hypothetical protein